MTPDSEVISRHDKIVLNDYKKKMSIFIYIYTISFFQPIERTTIFFFLFRSILRHAACINVIYKRVVWNRRLRCVIMTIISPCSATDIKIYISIFFSVRAANCSSDINHHQSINLFIVKAEQ